MATIAEPLPMKKPNKLEVASKITSKGQITLPVEIRRQLGVKEGDRVKFVVDGDGRTSVLPVRDEGENPFAKYVGILGGFDTREELMDWSSDLRGDDEWRKKDLDEWRTMTNEERQQALKDDENYAR